MKEKPKDKISQEKIDCILKIVDRWLDYQQFIKRIPGLSIGIVHKDKIILNKGYGFSNIQNNEKTTDKTLYRIASISKLFTSISIMQLVESEKINLDDDVSKYLKWAKSKNKITLRQLLTHSSGINRDGDTPHWINDNFPEIEKIIKHVSEGAVTYSPIEKFKYSNLGYTILGKVIEQVSGMTYKDYVKKNIIQTIRLENTYIDIENEAENKLATGYGRDMPGFERDKFNNPSTKSMAPAIGFVSNVNDLCKFMSAQFLTNNLLLRNETKKEMQRIQWIEETDNETITWGLGYEMWKLDNITLRGHGGGFPGFITQIAFDREKEFGVTVLTNALGSNAHDLTNGVFHIIHYILKNFDDFKKMKVNNINLKEYEGRFYERWSDIEVVEINKSLNFFYPSNNRPLKEIYKLKPKKDNIFTVETGNNFDYIGEEAIFEFGEDNKLSKIKIGPNTLTPFNDFVKNQKRS
ncbi:beta-lactamase family protein [Candidatus Pacearchaeota archaeon]|nr:beta-lactamase family protein [Candidatus Pacearchaeota archaeon]